MPNINYQFPNLLVNGKPYDLEMVRERVLRFYPNRIKNYFIKSIISEGKVIFTYDWDGFFNSQDFCLRVLKLHYFGDIGPVVAFSPDTFSTEKGLNIILGAINSQFVLHRDCKINGKGQHQAHSPLEVHSDRTLEKSAALSLYCGLVRIHGFDEKYAMELVGAEHEDFKDHWKYFKSYLTTDSQISEAHLEKSKRFANKVKLALAYIDSQVGYVSLSDLPH
jgi:hypothetical protein